MSAPTEAEGRALNFIEEIIEEDIRQGKNGGRVHTRFPPEPNAYAHLGHAGAALLNYRLAQRFGGKFNLRFDDTDIEVSVKGERMSSGRRKLGAIMGHGVQTGVNVSLHPGVIVGSGSWIAPGIIVQRDVEAGVIVYQMPDRQQRPR